MLKSSVSWLGTAIDKTKLCINIYTASYLRHCAFNSYYWITVTNFNSYVLVMVNRQESQLLLGYCRADTLHSMYNRFLCESKVKNRLAYHDLRMTRHIVIIIIIVGLGGFGVTSSPRDPRFAGSNPTEVDGFFQDVKILSTTPRGWTLSWGSVV